MSAILFLHGGGHSDHHRYTKLEAKFNALGIATRAFDHHATSLAGRLAEAEIELAVLKKEHHLTDPDIFVWGSSMGGHIACRLTDTHPALRGLILQSAAAYSKEAETIPFGPAFTTELQREGSWQGSPAFTSLRKYAGPTLVMYGEYDDIIPTGVKTTYQERAGTSGNFVILPGAGHSLLRPVSDIGLAAWDSMLSAAITFINQH